MLHRLQRVLGAYEGAGYKSLYYLLVHFNIIIIIILLFNPRNSSVSHLLFYNNELNIFTSIRHTQYSHSLMQRAVISMVSRCWLSEHQTELKYHVGHNLLFLFLLWWMRKQVWGFWASLSLTKDLKSRVSTGGAKGECTLDLWSMRANDSPRLSLCSHGSLGWDHFLLHPDGRAKEKVCMSVYAVTVLLFQKFS